MSWNFVKVCFHALVLHCRAEIFVCIFKDLYDLSGAIKRS